MTLEKTCHLQWHLYSVNPENGSLKKYNSNFIFNFYFNTFKLWSNLTENPSKSLKRKYLQLILKIRLNI